MLLLILVLAMGLAIQANFSSPPRLPTGPILTIIIGFLVFIPFVIIDLVVASVLMSMGMMMLSPVLISLPFKLMLFVLVDGWSLVMGTLAASFYT